MKTRSQTNKPTYEVIIDFDGASQAWRANKKSVGNGTYKYVCASICKSGKQCNRNPLTNEEFCKLHYKNSL
jgi:hypothetical protein